MGSSNKRMAWEDVPETADRWAADTLFPAWDIKQASALLLSLDPVHLCWHPRREKAAVCALDDDTAYVKQACEAGRLCLIAAVGLQQVYPKTLTEREFKRQGWVKVAQATTPGGVYNQPGDLPNAPTPLTAGLVSGLVGAGLGYGAGRIGEAVLPYNHEKGRLSQNLAMAGGGIGVLPSLLWAYSNMKQGLPANSNELLAHSKPAMLDYDALPKAVRMTKKGELAPRYVAAVSKFTKQAFSTGAGGDNDVSIDMNALGQVLWQIGAPPKTTATTMGAMYAAQQLPDPNARPGYVTSHQTGLLGTMMGAAGGGIKGYMAGAAVGKVLDVLTGTSADVQNTLRNAGAALGIINAVVPNLYR